MPCSNQGEEDDINRVIRPMQIFVRTLTGRIITLNVAGTDRIELIREMIWDSEQVLPSQQRLLYGGKQLEDGKDLGDYSVLGESTVYLVLRLCGGGIWPAPDSAQSYGCGDISEKCVDDGMSAIEQGAVDKLRMERQRHVVRGVDVRHCLAE